ncbi:hypothetical protein J2Z60_000185 [Lactobacillus colini]|uniref:Profilin n=1 Tax=Lactobacillus colini TaxID=1819254 RepID=A0ABS4MBH6_9LACO|nr:hypothetical protein [Lactobacillus colini]MBP2057023.1 hypothetical protein [Lactobacillus colini]
MRCLSSRNGGGSIISIFVNGEKIVTEAALAAFLNASNALTVSKGNPNDDLFNVKKSGIVVYHGTYHSVKNKPIDAENTIVLHLRADINNQGPIWGVCLVFYPSANICYAASQYGTDKWSSWKKIF